MKIKTSRWVQLLFPTEMEANEDVVEVKRRQWWIWGWRLSTGFDDIASIKMDEGLFFATIRIETQGGEEDLIIPGVWKNKAKEFYDLINSRRGEKRA